MSPFISLGFDVVLSGEEVIGFRMALVTGEDAIHPRYQVMVIVKGGGQIPVTMTMGEEQARQRFIEFATSFQ